MIEIQQALTPISNKVWDDVVVLMQAALDKSKNEEWTVEDARAWVDSGKGFLLVGLDEGAVEAAALCAIENYHQVRAMEIHLMAARPGVDWESLFPNVLHLARVYKCTHVRAEGRRWVKFFNKFGDARELYRAELSLQ